MIAPVRMLSPGRWSLIWARFYVIEASSAAQLQHHDRERHADDAAMTVLALMQDRQYRLWIALLCTAFAFLWFAAVWLRVARQRRRMNMPYLLHTAHGRAWPWLGHALQMLRYRPWDLLTEWHQTYGSILSFPLLGETYVSVADPHYAKLVLQSKIAMFKKDVQNTMKPFLSILGTGIVTSEDQAWLQQRLKMSHPLRHDVLQDIIPQQTLRAVQRLCAAWDDCAARGVPVEIGGSLRHLTLQVISGTFLSLTAKESDNTFAKMYLPIVDESNVRVWRPHRMYNVFLPSYWQYLANVRKLNQYVSGLISQRWTLRRQEEKEMYVHDNKAPTTSTRPLDILDGVLATFETQFPAYRHRPTLPSAVVRQFRDEMKTFMLAGHETSAAMMTWTLYELMANASIMQQVAAEGRQVFGDMVSSLSTTKSMVDLPLSPPSTPHLAKLTLAEACLKESLRKYSVVPIIARRSVHGLTLFKGNETCYIPAGASVMINLQALHHDAQLWPSPMKFDPSRFLNQQPMEPYKFMAFSAGPRNCLGQHLALLESKMVISLLTQRYEFVLSPEVSLQTDSWALDGKHDESTDPRHRFMVPVIPKTELKAYVKRKV